MEEQKIDKRSKAYRDSKESIHAEDAVTIHSGIQGTSTIAHPTLSSHELSKTQLEKFWDTGIPLTKAIFHAAVNNGDGTPENYFATQSIAKSRNVEMRLAFNGLWVLCKHRGRIFGTPHANTIEVFFN